MAASGASNLWPGLVAGARARASEVEQKFDWLEANILPMLSGSTTDLVYDLGTSTARWNFGNIDKIMCQSINATSTTKCVVIGTTTAVTTAANNSDVALEIAGNRSLLIPRLTTTQRNNLTGINGMIVYDSTLNLFQKYENGAWANMGGAVIGFVAPVFASVTSVATTTVLSVSAPGRIKRIYHEGGGAGGGDFRGQLTIDGIVYGEYTKTTSTIQWLYLNPTTTVNTATTFTVDSTTTQPNTLDIYFKSSLIVYHRNAGGATTEQTGVWYERT